MTLEEYAVSSETRIPNTDTHLSVYLHDLQQLLDGEEVGRHAVCPNAYKIDLSTGDHSSRDA